MDDDQLQANLLAILGMTNASEEMKVEALSRIQSIAYKRLSLALPEILTDEQKSQADAMEAAGKSDDEIIDWVQSQLPEYEEMIRTIFEDVANEVAEL
jgi:hypothetical protein